MAYTPWLKARTATIVINSITYDIESFEYQEQYSRDDATPITGGTNSAGALAEQFVMSTVQTTFRATFLVDSTNIKTLKGGRNYAGSYTSADGDVHSGDLSVLQRTKTVATKGAFRVSVSGEFNGVVAGQ